MKAIALALTLATLSAPAAAARWDQSETLTIDSGTHITVALDLDSVEASAKEVTATVRVRNLGDASEEFFQVLVPAKTCNAGEGGFGIYDLDGQIRARFKAVKSAPKYWDILAAGACFARAGVLNLPEPAKRFNPDTPARPNARINSF